MTHFPPLVNLLLHLVSQTPHLARKRMDERMDEELVRGALTHQGRGDDRDGTIRRGDQKGRSDAGRQSAGMGYADSASR